MKRTHPKFTIHVGATNGVAKPRQRCSRRLFPSPHKTTSDCFFTSTKRKKMVELNMLNGPIASFREAYVVLPSRHTTLCIICSSARKTNSRGWMDSNPSAWFWDETSAYAIQIHVHACSVVWVNQLLSGTNIIYDRHAFLVDLDEQHNTELSSKLIFRTTKSVSQPSDRIWMFLLLFFV